jgi:hypothetical protein
MRTKSIAMFRQNDLCSFGRFGQNVDERPLSISRALCRDTLTPRRIGSSPKHNREFELHQR